MRELLLLLCQYPYKEKDHDLLSKLVSEVKDWPELVGLINSHGIIALAAYNIKEAGLEDTVPVDSMAVLKNGYFQNVIRNTWLTERWKEVNSILCNAGIQHIVLKGMALEHTLYDSKGLRQMSDNDILIRHDESFKAWHLLKEAGFTPEPLKSPLFRKIMFDYGRHLPALCKEGYVIELHNKLFERVIPEEYSIDYTFSKAVEISIGNTKAYALPRDLGLKYLIEHFEHHVLTGECQLRLYADIVLSDDKIPIKFPENFITDPIQIFKTEYRKAVYRSNIHSIPLKHRLRFITGDTFPSIKWMKKRYNCGGFRALLFYPLRVGKLIWLIH